MNISFFEYVLEVNRARSITQAAENLFIAQPNLSKLIKEAEHSLGYTLFERTTKGVVPTAKGAIFIEYAQEVVKQLQAMESLADNKGDANRLYVSVPHDNYIAKQFISYAATLDKEQPFELYIKESRTLQTIRDVCDGIMDIGVIRYQNIHKYYIDEYLNEKRMESKPISSYSYIAIFSKEHKLAAKQEIYPKDLTGYIQILDKESGIPYLGKVRDTLGIESNKRIYAGNQSAQIELLRSLPEAFLLSPPVEREVAEKYGLISRKYTVPTNLYTELLIYRRGHEFSQIEQDFIDKLYESRGC